MVFGGVDTCIEKLRRLRAEGGVNYVLGWMNFGGMPDELVQRSMRLFAEEVMPALRDDAETVAAE
jgi:alkanesulfonate monooxygenase SsuD/methylene tetrahydromethanopterin reductase-like flavin-dependent oxidoreductase (luciferase family)